MKRYDVVVIGSGISGLISGCYLAKMGFKVLIVEKNGNIGGYGAYIKHEEFNFNLFTCMLGSFRKSGWLNKILFEELDLNNSLKINRNKIPLTVMTSGRLYCFDRLAKQLEKDIVSEYPREKQGLNTLLDYIFNKDAITLYTRLGKITFGILLDSLFKSSILKNMFYIPCGNYGIPPRDISAFSAVTFYRETVFDGGYTVDGGMEKFLSILTNRYKDYGGDLLINQEVVGALVGSGSSISSIELSSGERVKADYYIACCDIRHFFSRIIGFNRLQPKYSNIINKMVTTSSAFTLHLGLKSNVNKMAKTFKSNNVWFSECKRINRKFRMMKKNKTSTIIDYFLCNMSSSQHHQGDYDQLSIFVPSSFNTKEHWDEGGSDSMEENIIAKANQYFDGLANAIKYRYRFTPYDMYAYTFNYNGASKGWASIPSQNSSMMIPQCAVFNNLYIAGQWRNIEAGQGGITQAAYTGRKAAIDILRKTKRVISSGAR